MKIRIYKIEGCRYCDTLVQKIKEERIPATILDALAKENRAYTDSLDSFFGENKYPKVVVEREGKEVYITGGGGNSIHNFGNYIFLEYTNVEEIIGYLKELLL